jgi:hypothetical protein
MAKGKKIPQELIDEIDRLRMSCSPPKIIEVMKGRVSPRSVYRILQRLKLADEERRRELAERVWLALEREEAERRRRARLRGVRPFRSVAQILPRARVRAE